MDSSSLSSDLSEPPSSEPPSSPLSELSKSPSLSPSTATRSDGPPSRYLSPSSSTPSGRTSPMNPMKHSSEPGPEGDTICAHPEGAPPPPKRRRVEPKPRTTEYLNLQPGSADSEKDQALLNQLVSVLRKKKKIVIIAGAGISVSAGIPDFRSSHGLFKTVKSQHGLKASGKQLFDASVYKHDEATSNFHDMVRQLAQQTKNASPTPFHHLIASLAEEGRLLRLYSQNVDCIDTAMKPLATKVPLNMKGPWPKTVQMHGGLDTMQCSKCNQTYPFDGSLFEGPSPPPCESCVVTDNVRTSHAGKRSHGIGRLRPRMVLYNEYNPDTEAICNVIKSDMRSRPDAVLVVGTTLKIPGVRQLVKDMCGVTRSRRDGVTTWINLDPEPSGADLRDCWDIVVQGKCDDVARLVGLPHWDESHELGDDVKVDDKAFERSKGTKGRHFFSQGALEVRIPSPTLSSSSASASVKDESRSSSPVDAKPKSINKVQGIPTPTASPKIRTALPSRPSEKTKQSQIVFGGKPTKPEDAPAQAAAPRKQLPTQRKPRPSKKKAEPKPPAATVKSAFKATKAAPAQKSAKSANKACVDVAPPKDNAPPIETRTEFSLRPTVTRQRRETYIAESESKKDQAEVNSQLQQETIVHHSPPTTPTELERPGSSQSQTISPPSKPRGMAALIE